MKFEKILKMSVDAVTVKRQDGKTDLKLNYSLEEGKGKRMKCHESYAEIIPYEKLCEIQKRRAA